MALCISCIHKVMILHVVYVIQGLLYMFTMDSFGLHARKFLSGFAKNKCLCILKPTTPSIQMWRPKLLKISIYSKVCLCDLETRLFDEILFLIHILSVIDISRPVKWQNLAVPIRPYNDGKTDAWNICWLHLLQCCSTVHVNDKTTSVFTE